MSTRWYLRRDPTRRDQIWLQMDEVGGTRPIPRGATCMVFSRVDARAHLPILRDFFAKRVADSVVVHAAFDPVEA